MPDPDERLNSIIRKLKEKNHKLTPQRLAIAGILARSRGHPNVGKIYESLQDVFPKWRFSVQVMPEEDLERTPYIPFDLTMDFIPL